MNVVEWFNANQGFILCLSNFILIAVTLTYVILTNKILRTADKQFKVASNPIIGLKIKKMHIGKVYGPKRRTLTISLDIQNIGNSPAMDIQIDGELILSHTSIDGQKTIPAYGEPRRLPFLTVGEKEVNDFETDVHFGNKAIIYLFDDFRENSRLNMHRIETDPTMESYKAAKVRIIVYYNNNLGQLFQSVYDTHVDMGMDIKNEKDKVIIKNKDVPRDDEELELNHHPIVRPVFYSKLLTTSELDSEMRERNIHRDLSGW